MKLRGHKQFSLVLFRGRIQGFRRESQCKLNPGDRMVKIYPVLPADVLGFTWETQVCLFVFSLQSFLQIFKILIAWKANWNSICLSCHYVFMTLALQSKFLFNINSLAFGRVTTCSFLRSPNNMYKSIFSAVSCFHISRIPAYCFKVCHKKVFPIYYKIRIDRMFKSDVCFNFFFFLQKDLIQNIYSNDLNYLFIQ